MNRRSFLKASAGAPLAAAVSSAIPANPALAQAAPVSDGWRIFEVTAKVDVLKPVGTTRIWLPTPSTVDTSYQKSLGNSWSADGGNVELVNDARYGAGILSATFADGAKPMLSLTSRFATRNYSVNPATGRGMQSSPEELKRYLAATEFMPTDGVVKATADGIVKGARTDIEKARLIYEWVVENTYRDAKVRGCGVGDVKFMLENKSFGGKCGDLNALFVALCRAVGVPARDVYGIRVADSQRGYKSLGKSGDITRAQHCRAEFHAQNVGWIPVDPADVRKVILEEEGGKKIDDPKVVAARQFLWGNWEMNWLAYNSAHDVAMPGSGKSKLVFFMYPNAETADGRLDQLDPDSFKYSISSREII
jgi:transglutaminase-like putative cysteine protease